MLAADIRPPADPPVPEPVTTRVSSARLSLNQITADAYDTRAVVEACVRHGIGWISLWRHKVAELGIRETAALVRDAGLSVSSLCRGGFFAAATEAERQGRHDDNRRALEEAAELGTDVLVLVCGPAPDHDLGAARRMVVDGIERLLPDAERLGVRLGVEALHPVYAGDRSVVVTLGQANSIAERFPPELVGVIVDAYHVWWDPEVYAQIQRAGDRVLGFHVSDWLVPSPDPLMGRGVMGDGVIELRRLRAAVEETGYDGPIEVEIFNQKVWDTPLDEMLPLLQQRFVEHV
jgi:sugar phosphate isomerase/epimerase